MTPRAVSAHPELSVVVPVHNEQDNIASLIEEIVAALRGRIAFEIVYVDDCSRDATPQKLRDALGLYPELRALRHTSQSGQSTAVRNGVKAARGAWIATLDGDGQNDPADIPEAARGTRRRRVRSSCYAGWRVNRQDSGSKRWASKWANAIRSAPAERRHAGHRLRDQAVRARRLPRPALLRPHAPLPAGADAARRLATVSVPVNHRPRTAGVSKYNNLVAPGRHRDLRGVAWLIKRSKRSATQEMERP
jgi:dolichol-phosphate mannosyltransferase